MSDQALDPSEQVRRVRELIDSPRVMGGTRPDPAGGPDLIVEYLVFVGDVRAALGDT